MELGRGSMKNRTPALAQAQGTGDTDCYQGVLPSLGVRGARAGARRSLSDLATAWLA